MRLAPLAALVAAACVAAPARAEKLDQLRLGATVSGPTHDPKELAGQVVLVEFWGIS
jgi:hypothetical protein